MKMTPALLIFGGLMVFWTSVFVAVFLPALTMEDKQSSIWRTLSPEEDAGHRLYVNNGCSYCHSLFIRNFDWDIGAERITEAGDYHGFSPIILGTERTGPDLSQQGGEHPDDWHLAHFYNPRYTRPLSLMPSWEFLGRKDVDLLTAYVQGLGGKMADQRIARQNYWRKAAQEAYAAGPAANIAWLHARVPQVWQDMPNPYPATDVNIQRGHRIYQEQCINCHGPIGDGQGRAASYLNPQPLNFTTLRGFLAEGKYIGGIFYYQIMNGITGTSMPYFKRDLESEKIWDVSNYVAVQFVGYSDANIAPRGIDASNEPGGIEGWQNPYKVPKPQLASRPSTHKDTP